VLQKNNNLRLKKHILITQITMVMAARGSFAFLTMNNEPSITIKGCKIRKTSAIVYYARVFLKSLGARTPLDKASGNARRRVANAGGAHMKVDLTVSLVPSA
jgi:hypothetical protein